MVLWEEKQDIKVLFGAIAGNLNVDNIYKIFSENKDKKVA